MKTFARLLTATALVASLNSAARAQPPMDAIPIGPFKTIHLLVATPDQEGALTAAISDYNRSFIQDGCPTCGYHLYKLAAGNPGKYAYAMIGDWPSRDAYVKVHASPTFAATSKRDPIISDMSATEIYGRYVEVNRG